MTTIDHDPLPPTPASAPRAEPVPFADILFEQMRDGAAWLRLLDTGSAAADFELLRANPAFTQHTGLKPVAGQRLSELLPDLPRSDPYWFDSLVKVASGAGGEAFDCHVVALGRRFSGRLFQPQAGHLVLMLGALPDPQAELQTDVQHYERALAEQRAILDSNLVGLVRTCQRRITWANAAAEALFGYSRVEMLGQTTEHLYPSREAFQRFADEALPVVRAGGVFRGESRIQRKDGSLCWFSHQVTQLAPGSDEHVSSFIDITARVEAEAALMRSQAQLRGTFAAMSEGIVLQQADGRILEANPAAERILGLTREQLLGRSSLDPQWQAVHEDGSAFPGEDHPGMVALRTGLPQHEQMMGISSPDGGQRWIRINADPVVYSGGNRPDAVVATFSDITERRRIEAELTATAAELRDLYDNAPCGYHCLDAEGRVLLINRTELAWLGRSRDEVIGRRIVEFFPEQAREVYRRNFPRLMAEGQVSDVEIELASADGTRRRVAVNSTVVTDDQGRVVRTRTILHDITALAHAEQVRLDAVRLEAENMQMRETNRLKALFIANMSHELKTPLNGVLGVVQLLELGLVKPGTARFNRFIAQLGSSGRQLSQLIDDILDHASLEAGRLPFRPQEVDLAVLVRDVVNIVRPDAERKQLVLSVQVDEALGNLQLDPLRLKQVCANFLSNAVKFTADGGRVAMRASAEGLDHFRIEVEDTGIGIAEKDLPTLFVEFHQLSAGRTKQYQGTGLGLALTRRIVEHQGGSVGVRSTPGVGSVFHAVLPRRAAGQAPAAAEPRKNLGATHR